MSWVVIICRFPFLCVYIFFPIHCRNCTNIMIVENTQQSMILLKFPHIAIPVITVWVIDIIFLKKLGFCDGCQPLFHSQWLLNLLASFSHICQSQKISKYVIFCRLYGGEIRATRDTQLESYQDQVWNEVCVLFGQWAASEKIVVLYYCTLGWELQDVGRRY